MIQPRYYQRDAVDAIYNYFNSGKKGNPLVCLPTGTGKSVVIGGFIWSAFNSWPNIRVTMLTHDEKLISQNAAKLKEIWPLAPVGICCAGLKRKEIHFPITYGSLKTVANIIKSGLENNAPHLGYVDLVLIDECHLVSPDEETQYRYVITELLKVNPHLKVVGFTATPYRLKLGHLLSNGIFTDICYDVTDADSINRFIQDGFLCNIVAKRTNAQIDLKGVRTGASGEFSEKSSAEATDKEELLIAAIEEMKAGAWNRKSWLIFTPSISVCEHVADLMCEMNLNVTFVHSKLKEKEQKDRIAAFKAGEYLGIVNKDMLTTGFDHPPIDFIGNLRLTQSPGLWVQMVGRGFRPYDPEKNYIPGFPHKKQDCLVFDFAANTARLGPINAPNMPKPPGKGGGDAPVWVCPECSTYNAAAARFCVACGLEHTFEIKFSAMAATDALLKDSNESAHIEFFKVTHVTYAQHEKKGKAPSLKVTYYCGMQSFTEYLGFESDKAFVKKKCKDWWFQRTANPLPMATYEALAQTKNFRVPNLIKVNLSGQYPEIISAEW
jgi:DNA repair protein RadD